MPFLSHPDLHRRHGLTWLQLRTPFTTRILTTPHLQASFSCLASEVSLLLDQATFPSRACTYVFPRHTPRTQPQHLRRRRCERPYTPDITSWRIMVMSVHTHTPSKENSTPPQPSPQLHRSQARAIKDPASLATTDWDFCFARVPHPKREQPRLWLYCVY